MSGGVGNYLKLVKAMTDALSSVVSSYEKAIEVMSITPSQLPPDPLAPSCHQYRLRPSEEAAIICNLFLNPPPPWGIKINLHRSFIGGEKCLQLARKMILNQTVTYLDLSMCDLEERNAIGFFQYLQRNKTLKHLNVNGNRIKDVGVCAAAKCISNLETLHVASNEISDVGAIAIADELRESKTLKTLNIRSNHITVYGVYRIMDALEPSFGLMPTETQEFITAREKEASTLLFKSSSTLNVSSVEEELLGTIVEDTGAAAAQTPKSYPVSVSESTEKVANSAEQQEHEDEDKKYNGTLHTLWVDYNATFPDEVLKSLHGILAKRFPQPPPGAIKKKKRKK